MRKTQAQRDFEKRIRQSRGLAHPAAPRPEGTGWETRCERSGCERTFLTPTKQRRYCSNTCQNLAEKARARRVDVLTSILLYSCAAPHCSNVFLPDRRNPRHMYCSTTCRKRGYRAASDLSPVHCAFCMTPFPHGKSRRRRYCDATCRKRAQRAARRNEN